MSYPSYRLYYQRHLPHYQPPGAALFITFRLAGSLPLEVIRQLKMETESKQQELDRISDPHVRNAAEIMAQKKIFASWDQALDDTENSPDWLSILPVAELICEVLHHHDGKSYTLIAYCVMPNHVHLVCRPLCVDGQPIPLSRIMKTLKGSTARGANILLGKQGTFWQQESYDHAARDNPELERIVNYVLNNPCKAGLPDRWTYCAPEFKSGGL